MYLCFVKRMILQEEVEQQRAAGGDGGSVGSSEAAELEEEVGFRQEGNGRKMQDQGCERTYLGGAGKGMVA